MAFDPVFRKKLESEAEGLHSGAGSFGYASAGMDIDFSNPPVEPLELVKIQRDIVRAAGDMSVPEVRYLVDLYYTVQDYRIASQNRVRKLVESDEPHALMSWALRSFTMFEDEARKALDSYTKREPTGSGLWLRSITGIGPVIAAGLVANLDIQRAPTTGHWWRFAGLDPTVTWEKGQKRPWNAGLKTLCWKLGESFVKVSNNPNDVYGHIYSARKRYEAEKNERLEYKDQAEHALATRRLGKDTDAFGWYTKGMLPPARIHARAKRYAVKMLLSHYHHVAFENTFDKAPPVPFPIAHLGHVHLNPPPNHVCSFA